MSNDVERQTAQEKEALLFKAYELYLAERTRLTSAKFESSKAYDRTILTFSAGAFGLSVTFLEKIAPTAQSSRLLYLSWVGFALAMASTTYSLLASQRATEKAIENHDEEFKRLIGLTNTESVPSASEQTRFGVSKTWLRAFTAVFSPFKSIFSRSVVWLNRAAGVFFFAGILFFGWFALDNWVKPTTEDSVAKQSKIGGGKPRLPESSTTAGNNPDKGVLPPINKVPPQAPPPSQPPAKGKK